MLRGRPRAQCWPRRSAPAAALRTAGAGPAIITHHNPLPRHHHHPAHNNTKQAIDHTAKALAAVHNRGGGPPVVFNTYQAYLRGSYERMLEDMERARRDGYRCVCVCLRAWVCCVCVCLSCGKGGEGEGVVLLLLLLLFSLWVSLCCGATAVNSSDVVAFKKADPSGKTSKQRLISNNHKVCRQARARRLPHARAPPRRVARRGVADLGHLGGDARQLRRVRARGAARGQGQRRGADDRDGEARRGGRRRGKRGGARGGREA